jgi:predicted DNA-binding WGR domain protein
MTALTLRRSDPIRNMHRYYRLDVQLDLFGAWCFIREWGRIGQAGQTRTVLYLTSREAQAALERQRRAKERRGYARANVDDCRPERAQVSAVSGVPSYAPRPC